MNNWEDQLQTIQIQLAKSWGPIGLAMIPALFTGYEVYYLFPNSGLWAFIFAFVVSTGLELGSFLVINTALELSLNRKYFRAGFMWILSLSWCSLVAWIIYTGYANTVPELITNLGTGGPFAAFIGYIALTFDKQLKEEKIIHVKLMSKNEQIETDNLAWKREQQRLVLQQEHERKLEEIRLKSEEKRHRLDTKILLNIDNKKASKFDNYLTLKKSNPDISIAELAERLKVTRQTIYNWEKKQ